MPGPMPDGAKPHHCYNPEYTLFFLIRTSSTTTPSPPTTHRPPQPTMSTPLPPSSVERYSRQILLPTFGVRAQTKLQTSRALIVGCGGLGSPALLYLAGAGVSVLGLVDRPHDVVDRSNLHRQIAHADARVGQSKVASAAAAARALNPHVVIETHAEFVARNAVELVSTYHVVLDCTDNVAARYLVSDACAAAKVPLVSGAAIGMEGQLTVYCAGADTPCYRCVFPAPPPPSCVGSCDAAGVLGPVPGVIGTMQALEALKLLGGIEKTTTLKRKLLLFDAADSAFRTVKLRPRARECPACGDEPSIEVAQFAYDAFALGGDGKAPVGAVTGEAPAANAVPGLDGLRISAETFAEIRKDTSKYRLIDVRPEAEFAICHLEEAKNYPLADLPSSGVLVQGDNADTVQTIFICRRGNSSQKALKQAVDRGMQNAVDVIGGLQSWHHKVDANFPLY